LKFNSRIASRVTCGAISAFTQDTHSQDMHPRTEYVIRRTEGSLSTRILCLCNSRSCFPRYRKTSCKI